MNWENKEESNQERKASNHLMNQVIPIISKTPIEALNGRSLVLSNLETYSTIQIAYIDFPFGD